MSHRKQSHLPFTLDGQFLGFVVKDGYKVKGLRLATMTGELYIKLGKEARASCYPLPQPGVGLHIMGEQTVDYKDGTVTFKASQIQTIPLSSLPPLPERGVTEPKRAKACILVCQKSDCCKRGGRDVVKALQRELEARQLADQISIRGTGCMKQCKAGPNLVMPDKTRHSRVRPREIPHLLEHHGGVTVGAIAG